MPGKVFSIPVTRCHVLDYNVHVHDRQEVCVEDHWLHLLYYFQQPVAVRL
jgi:hypothetical protein